MLRFQTLYRIVRLWIAAAKPSAICRLDSTNVVAHPSRVSSSSCNVSHSQPGFHPQNAPETHERKLRQRRHRLKSLGPLLGHLLALGRDL